MSKGLKATIYVDERVSSITSARDYAEHADRLVRDLKSEIWALILSTPKDVVKEGEDPISELKERFEMIWEDLWDNLIDSYKYNAIADDAEFDDESLVKKCWEEEEKERQEYEKEAQKRDDFFKRYKGVLNPYNFDDMGVYEDWSNGKLSIGETFTKEDRDRIVAEKNAYTQKLLEDELKKMKKNEQG